MIKGVKIFISTALLCACFLFAGISCGGGKTPATAPASPAPSVSIIPSSPPVPKRNRENAAVKPIRDLINAGRYEEAVKKIDSGVLKNLTPGDFEDISDLLRNAGKKEEALEVVDKAHDKYPDNKDILRLYSNLLFDCGYPDDAEEAITQAKDREGKSPGYYYMILGELSILKRDKDEAEENLRKSVEFLGIESRRLKVPEGTLPAYAEACTLYGSVMLKQKKFEKARLVFEKALTICDKIEKQMGREASGDRYSAVYFQLARLNIIYKNLPEALKCVENVGKYAPGSMDYSVIRSEYDRAAGDFKSAEKILLDMIKEKPLMEDEASIRLSSVYCGMKDRAKALKYFRLAMSKTGNKEKILSLMRENPFFDFIKDEPEVKKTVKAVEQQQ